MSTIKETTLHPDGNEGVDLYPKTNINQVQELPQRLSSMQNQVEQLNIDKLTKPTNPSAESAVTMLADGTVGTKLLSEIGGGGGKLYIHRVTFGFDNNADYYLDIPTNTNDDITVDFLRNYIKGDCTVSYNGVLGRGAVNLSYIGAGVAIRGVVYDGSGVNGVDVFYSDATVLVIDMQTLIEL